VNSSRSFHTDWEDSGYREPLREAGVLPRVRSVAAGLALSLSAGGCSGNHLPAAPTRPAAVASSSREPDPAPYLPDGCPPGEHDVGTWKRVDPSSVSDDQQFSLSYSPCTWSPSLRKGLLTAKEHQDTPLALPATFHTPEGKGSLHVARQGRAGILLGYNNGEWGGSLTWTSNDGSIKRELLDDNVVAILETDGRFVVLAGFSHLCSDHGRVVEYIDEADSFRQGRMTELGSAPKAAVVEPTGAILIATAHGLFRLTPEFHVHRLQDSHWGMFYPVSIVMAGPATVYVGMRGIVGEVKLDIDPPTETWLFPR
jgi:hypothetical protein